MRTFTRAVTVLAVAVAALVTWPTQGGASSAVDVRNFEAEGLVAVSDMEPITPTREGFLLDRNATLSPQAESGRNSNGTVPVYVRPDTRYYKYSSAAGGWKPATYDEVVTRGALLKVGGRYVAADGRPQLTATFVWAPPPPNQARPANPGPAQLRDFTFQRTFNVLGAATQRGIRVPTSGLYCGPCGFVIGGLTDDGGNDLVSKIAAAHGGQLIITSSPTTKYYVQGEDGEYHPSSLEQTVGIGAPLRVAGKFAFVDSDWRFLATYVWQPSPEVQRGLIEWITTVDGEGAGVNVAGDAEVYPGTTDLDLTWTPDGTGTWSVRGTWEAGDAAGKGTILGSLEGSWDPRTGAVDAIVVLSDGTLRHAGLTGSGQLTGTAVGPTGAAPTRAHLSFRVAVERLAAPAPAPAPTTEPTEDAATADEPTEDAATADEPTEDAATADEPTEDPATAEEPGEGSAPVEEEQAEDTTAEDRSGDDGIAADDESDSTTASDAADDA